MSWAPEVKTPGDTEFIGNGLRFATKEEAEANVAALAKRWTLVTHVRTRESIDPVNYAWVDGDLVPVAPSNSQPTTASE
jgi:hypothetical protein